MTLQTTNTSKMTEDEVEVENKDEIVTKKTTSFVKGSTKKNKRLEKAEEKDLEEKLLEEKANNIYWAKILLLFPLLPVCVALTTVTFGGVIINVASTACNSRLLPFMQGAVVLSYILIAFYTYCWMGPRPIKSLRVIQVFYVVYGFVCFIWWGIFGTLHAATATSSGFQSCRSTSPALYIMSQYEVAIFWIIFLIFVGFIVKERSKNFIEKQMAKRREMKRLEEEEKARMEAEIKELERKEAEEKAKRDKEAKEHKEKEEQDRLYDEHEDGKEENLMADNQDEGDDEPALDQAANHESEEEDDDDEEEEVFVHQERD